MPSLADLLRSQNFGPNDSLIASSINHPLRAGKKLSDWIARQTQTAAGIPEQYDNPNPLLAPSPSAQSQAAFDLAGLVQGGAMPFAPATKGGTLGSITAWHGSPHKFDKFSMDKIGTGEGAQAYGHGLYFAEHPEVAKEYSKNMPILKASDGHELPFNNNSETPEGYIHSLLSAFDGDYSQIKHEISTWENKYPGNNNKFNNQLLELLNKYETLGVKPEQGNLYKTSLEWPDPAREAADPLGPHHFLDWDKPLSEQPNILPQGVTLDELVAGAKGRKPTELEKFQANLLGRVQRGELDPSYATGRNLYDGRNTTQYPNQAAFSEKLNQLGIPGIRYLDGGSRGAGEGSYNYVIFDDKIPKIKERNGNPLSKLLPATMLGYGMANQRSLSDYFGAQ